MNRNNYMYKLFNEMKAGYAEDDLGKIEQCARCWMQLDPENPFVYDTPEYEEFFQIKKCYTIWTRGDIDQKINRRRMVNHAKALCALNPKQPYVFDKKAEAEDKRIEEEKRKEAERKHKEIEEKKLEEQKKQEQLKDSKYILLKMTEAYNTNDNDTFKNYATYLTEITVENPFAEETPEFYKFEEMKAAYVKHNMRRLHVLAGELCDIVNYTEIEPEEIKKVKSEEPKKVLGVPNEEKKSWFKFLHPWR